MTPHDTLKDFDPFVQDLSPKCTVISIVPFLIKEFKPGLFPAYFELKPCTDPDEPQTLVISECVHFIYIDFERKHMRIRTPSYFVARSIVTDYNQAQIGSSHECHPGLFWAPGEWTPQKISADEGMREKLRSVRDIQMNWFQALLTMADDDWEKIRQHSAISDMQRMAARVLDPGNTRQRPWVVARPEDFKLPERVNQTLGTTPCPGCQSEIPDSAVICKFCRCVVNPEAAKHLQFAGDSGMDVGAMLRGAK